jgi:virulence-associated protein VapD
MKGKTIYLLVEHSSNNCQGNVYGANETVVSVSASSRQWKITNKTLTWFEAASRKMKNASHYAWIVYV